MQWGKAGHLFSCLLCLQSKLHSRLVLVHGAQPNEEHFIYCHCICTHTPHNARCIRFYLYLFRCRCRVFFCNVPAYVIASEISMWTQHRFARRTRYSYTNAISLSTYTYVQQMCLSQCKWNILHSMPPCEYTRCTAFCAFFSHSESSKCSTCTFLPHGYEPNIRMQSGITFIFLVTGCLADKNYLLVLVNARF